MIPQTQGSTEWKEWRRNKIGASEAAICLGISPWQTPYGLYIEKTEGGTRYVNPAMARGTALEEVARLAYENLTGNIMFPEVMVHPAIDWAIASLDGINLTGTLILEIKCPNKDSHQKAISGIIEPHYMAQIQHQLWVTGVDMAHYFSYLDEGSFVLLEVKRDEAFISKIMEAECAFMTCLNEKTPPPQSATDTAKIFNKDAKEHELDFSSDQEWVDLEMDYMQVSNELQLLEARKEKIRKDMDLHAGGCNVKGLCTMYTKVVRPGAVDYSRISALSGINLDQYRKEPVVTFRLTISKAKE